MKKLITIAAILMSFCSYGQIFQKSTTNNAWNRVKADSALYAPLDTFQVRLATQLGQPVGDSGRIAYKNNVFYGRNITSWQPFALGDLSFYYTKVQSDTIFRNYVQAKRYGAKGDGTLNDSAALKHASDSNNSVFLNKGDYLVSGLYNPHGATWFGDGRIVKSVTGGLDQLNSYADINQHIVGKEYLAYFQRKLNERSNELTNVKVILSGNSTTAGDGLSGTYYFLDSLLNTKFMNDGIGGVQVINRGHSGKNSYDWINTYLSSDLAETPDLYVVRWGINDCVYNNLDSFITAMRSGLQTIRASKSVAQLSIILMAPNSTYDVPNNRGTICYENMVRAIKQAARDYKCTFIDTYAMWQDSRPAADVWMDNPYSDGRTVHPLDIMNLWITSVMYDVMMPPMLKERIGKSKVLNYVSVDRLKNPADLPPSYLHGISLDRAYKVDYSAWPLDGQATNIKQSNGVDFQINTSYLKSDSGLVYFRTSGVEPSTDPSTAIWSPWSRFVTENSGGVTKVNVGLMVGTSTLGAGNSANFSGGNITNTSVGSTFSSALASGSAGLTLNNGSSAWQWGVNNGAAGSVNHSFMYNAGVGDYQMSFNISGNTGVKTTAPSSTLHVAGSFATAITTTGSNINLTADHGTLIATSALTVTLPTAASAPGRIYYIVNYNTGGNVTFSIGVLKGGATVTTMTNNAAWRLQSNGTSWYVTGE